MNFLCGRISLIAVRKMSRNARLGPGRSRRSRARAKPSQPEQSWVGFRPARWAQGEIRRAEPSPGYDEPRRTKPSPIRAASQARVKPKQNDVLLRFEPRAKPELSPSRNNVLLLIFFDSGVYNFVNCPYGRIAFSLLGSRK